MASENKGCLLRLNASKPRAASGVIRGFVSSPCHAAAFNRRYILFDADEARRLGGYLSAVLDDLYHHYSHLDDTEWKHQITVTI